MTQSYYAYLDAFDMITLIIPKALYHPNTRYTLEGNDEIINLEIKEVINIGLEEKIVTTFDAYINLETIYHVVSDNNERSELFMGKIVRTSLFDSIYFYKKNDLGVSYSKKVSKFKIWSPIAKKIILELVDKGDKKEFRNLFYKNQGVWKAEVEKDLEGYKYRYHVYLNGKEKISLDPYAISSSANSEYNYIIDKTKLYKLEYPSKRPDSPLKSIIYETSIMDFTGSFKDMKNRSTYLGFKEEGLISKDNHPLGFDYLKSLGITHIQLLPFFAFGGVDEKDRDKLYNWGYNPVEYNVPSGLYANDPDDPYDRINNLKMMIDAIHKAGMNVVMDVVFNHVYKPDEFSFEILCPGYAYLYNIDGIRTSYSGCINDINSSKKMMRKFIIDSIVYWAKEYNIDGFRMDLMGLLDFETVNDIRGELDEIDEKILLYGEGWKMLETNASDSLAHMFNKNVHPTIGFFNDRAREAIKNYVIEDNSNLSLLKEVILGSSSNRYLFKYARQSINYVECHDDMTLFDSIRKKRELSLEEARKRSLLATSMIIMSLGMPFIHSGQELFRTKSFKTNSYNSSLKDNMLPFDEMDKNIEYVEYLKKLIKIRKDYASLFSLESSTEIISHTSILIKDDTKTIIFKIKLQDELMIIFKNSLKTEDIRLDAKYKILLASSSYQYQDMILSLDDIMTIVLIKE